MKMRVGRKTIDIYTDEGQDIAFWEDTLGIKEQKDFAIITRGDGFYTTDQSWVESLEITTQADLIAKRTAERDDIERELSRCRGKIWKIKDVVDGRWGKTSREIRGIIAE